ncbi:rRNA-binding ribosome biosynthesis protein [Elasticomyces elasticus]|nr:rRNA-binding ribosome biosynthesis protein [Elasticomyces elasticus]
MAKKRVKKRTHAGAKGPPHGFASSKPGDRTPKSMVIRIGASDVGPSVSQLVKDVRSMMEPGTATRLQERRSNKLRDYTTMAGPLGVTHLMLFSRSEKGNTNLRLAITPRGPTLHFRVQGYSLCKDVLKSMKRPKSGGVEYMTAPLLVMNNFTTPSSSEDAQKPSAIPKHLESLTTTIFQSLFPPISPQSTPLKSIKRVLLLNRETLPSTAVDTEPKYILTLRHYAISTPPARSAVPKPLRRLNAAGKPSHSTEKRKRTLPNLGRLGDIAEYLLDPNAAAGFTSGSESEGETDAEVEVLAPSARKVTSQHARSRANDDAANGDGAGRPMRGARSGGVEKRAVRLQELGPRMTLRLTKVEEGVCGGKVMWHEYIHKTKEEQKAQEKVWGARKREREERRRVQKENVEKKRRERKADGAGEGVEEDDEDMGDGADDDFWDDDDDDEYMDADAGAGVEAEQEDEDMVEEEIEDEDG